MDSLANNTPPNIGISLWEDFCQISNVVISPLCTIVSVILLVVAYKRYKKIKRISELYFLAQCKVYMKWMVNVLDDILNLYTPAKQSRGSGSYNKISVNCKKMKEILDEVIRAIPPKLKNDFPLSTNESIYKDIMKASSVGTSVTQTKLSAWQNKIHEINAYINEKHDAQEKELV